MPYKTFLNLPEEKRKHLLDSAKKEFTEHTFMDASINKIIQDAKIPRGSFYQYFEDKEDLYFYVFDTVKEDMMMGIKQEIAAEDSILEIFTKIYDFLYFYIINSNQVSYYRNVMITFHKLEVKPDEKELFFNSEIQEEVKKRMKLTEEEKTDFFHVLSFTFSKLLIDRLKNKKEQEQIRRRFIRLLEIFKNGYEEEER